MPRTLIRSYLSSRIGRGSMSKAHALAQHLPYLRRYARALTGNQASGDAYVAATLETLVKDPELVEAADLPRVSLFRHFSTIWNSLPANGAADPVANLMPAERHLGQIVRRSPARRFS